MRNTDIKAFLKRLDYYEMIEIKQLSKDKDSLIVAEINREIERRCKESF